MSRQTVIIGAVVIVLVMGALLASRQLSAPGADVPLLGTPAWRGEAPAYGQQLLLRRDARAERVLLLKHSGHDGGYRYDAGLRNLTSVPEEEWTRAGGPVAECGTQGPPSAQVLRIDPQTHRLVTGHGDVTTAGQTVLTLAESPSRRLVAVLSASGPSLPSLLPFLGAGAAAGGRVHQLVSLPDPAIVGNAIRIPVQRNDEVLSACWSADEKAIVYHDLLFTHVSVVEL